jgi:positive regulator of sigma E activity
MEDEMEERGVVIEKSPGKAQVRIERSESCEGCHGCLYSDTGKYMVAEVIDRIGVSIGDVVKIATEGASPLKASVMLFLFPLAMLFAGYAAGAALAPVVGLPGAGQGVGIAVGAVFFFGSFGLLALYTRRKSAGKTEQSVVVEILGRQENAT